MNYLITVTIETHVVLQNRWFLMAVVSQDSISLYFSLII